MESNDWQEGLARDIEAPHCTRCDDWHTGPCRDEACERCAEFDEVHDARCPNHPDYDPTPYCSHCGPKSACDCGPIADND